MYLVRFTTIRVLELAGPEEFESRVGRWLAIREAENTFLYAALGTLKVAQASRASLPQDARERYFVLEDAGAIVAAGVLLASGRLCMTWATQDMIDTLADHAFNAGWKITSVYAPEYVSWQIAASCASRNGMHVETGKPGRIYQLSRIRGTFPTGRLDLATPSDKSMLEPWIHHFAHEVSLESTRQETENSLELMLQGQMLYLWKSPTAVAMAAWLAPTPRGVSISYVYVPLEQRGKGFGKAVAAALAAQLMSQGMKYCFIHTDTDDHRANHMYQSIGANVVCEVLRCTLKPAEVPATTTAVNASAWTLDAGQLRHNMTG